MLGLGFLPAPAEHRFQMERQGFMLSRFSPRQKMIAFWAVCALALLGLFLLVLHPREAYTVFGGEPQHVTGGMVSCADYDPVAQTLTDAQISQLDDLLSSSTVRVTGFYGSSPSLEEGERLYSLAVDGLDDYGNSHALSAEFHAGDGAFWVPPFRYSLPKDDALALCAFLEGVYAAPEAEPS